MKHCIIFMPLLIFCFACREILKGQMEKPITEAISIFEISLQDSVAVEDFSNFLRDTLELPVEW
jgi:hypothetical protein